MQPLFSARFRAQAQANLRLALPLIAAQLSFVSMGAVDAVMAGRLGATALAAVAVGSNVWFLLFVVFMGLFMAVSPIVAQRAGAGRPMAETGDFVRAALVLGVIAGLLWMAVLWSVKGFVLDRLGVEAQTRELAERYLSVISLAAVPMCLCFVLRNVAEGLGRTRVPLLVGLAGIATNFAGNYVFMYGKLGLPALGAVGCAWGSVTCAFAMAGTYLALFRLEPRLAELALARRGQPRLRRDAPEILRLGLSICAIVVAESWLFSVGALVIARFGTDAIAAHQIAINVASMCFMVPLSIGMATTVRVGQAAGAADLAEVALRGRAGMALGVGFALLSAALMALFPATIVGLYTDVESVAALASRFLLFAALFQVFDGLQATANGALRGLKDTAVPMIVTVSAYWLLGMPFAAWLALATPVGPAGIWCGFILGLAVAAVGLGARFLRRTRLPPAQATKGLGAAALTARPGAP